MFLSNTKSKDQKKTFRVIHTPYTPVLYSKTVFTEVYTNFLFLLENMECTHNLCLEQKQEKNPNFSSENYHSYKR